MQTADIRPHARMEPDISPDALPLLEGSPDEEPRRGRRTNPAARVKLLVAGALALLAVGYLVFSATQTSAVYYLTIPELEALGQAASTQQVRVGGLVVPGSIQRDGTTLRFRIVDGELETPIAEALQSGKTMAVVYTGVVPDIFQDEVHVVVEGKLTPSGEFDARTLLAKCPSRFEAAPN
ncbi:MAG: cytochrome c maturation protein CcmE [Chloroflexi bacterium]|nr:cytochrome c maturation protein CcmE [Chloroflexota bacterium]